MILEIQHETLLEYSQPVTESVAEVRMEPASGPDQSCCSFHLAVGPATPLFRYTDGFGNHVHHFSLLAPHTEMRVLAASVIETHPQAHDLGDSRAIYPLVPAEMPLEVHGFLHLRGPVRATPLLQPLLETLRPPTGTRVIDLVMQVCHYIYTHFTYARAVTAASSPIDDVLAKGKGVCQDFAHLMIAVLRRFGVPARYVSGYIHRPNKESQSHAWCEAWLPDCGWIGIDPTHDQIVNGSFVKVAVGRDFTDVSPNRGIYRGQVTERISVRVATRALERLPNLSWQDQLPSLDVPLTTVLNHREGLDGQSDEQMERQQQQQQ
jgi:transglutaminase-like putative cysteine protease